MPVGCKRDWRLAPETAGRGGRIVETSARQPRGTAMNAQHRSTRTRHGVATLALALGVAVAAPFVSAPSPASAAPAIQSRTVAAEAALATQALARAVTQARTGHLGPARTSLDAVRTHSSAANLGALR